MILKSQELSFTYSSSAASVSSASVLLIRVGSDLKRKTLKLEHVNIKNTS